MEVKYNLKSGEFSIENMTRDDLDLVRVALEVGRSNFEWESDYKSAEKLNNLIEKMIIEWDTKTQAWIESQLEEVGN